MKITNILLTVAVAGAFAGCDKNKDTANPGDMTPETSVDAPSTDMPGDDMGMDEADEDMGGGGMDESDEDIE